MNNMSKEKIGERITYLISNSPLNDSKLATIVGVSKVTIGKWRKGEAEPSSTNVVKLAKALGSTVPYIAQGINDGGELADTKKVEGWDDSTPLDDDEFEIPHYAHVTVSAGDKVGDVQEITDRKIRMSKSSARKAGASLTQSFSYNIDGDSMEEKITDGARCTADKSKTEIKDGKIYVFRHGVMRRTKYLFRQPNGGLIIRSHNKEYKDEFVSPEDMSDIEILGWVWEWSNMERW